MNVFLLDSRKKAEVVEEFKKIAILYAFFRYRLRKL